MKTDGRKPEGTGFEQYQDDINWTAGVGRPAGVYWLDGRTVIAAHQSPAEENLVGRGAVLVATLRFDADPRERVHRHGTVERMRPATAARAFFVSSAS